MLCNVYYAIPVLITLNTADKGYWMVSDDYTETAGWLRSSLQGDITVPRTGWVYYTPGSGW